jgi:hemolysin III
VTELSQIKVKPRLRGTFHFIAFFAALFGIFHLSLSPLSGWRYAAGLVYGASLALMLGLSGLYHRPMWGAVARNRLRMADHIGVFFLIAGTYTPFAALQSPQGPTVGLVCMWLAAVGGVTYAVVNSHGHRFVRSGLYVALGLCCIPMVASLPALIGWGRLWLLIAGGLIYIAGAVVYARRWPNPRPQVFGYHEVFHAMVLVAAGCHYAAVLSVQQA